MKRAYAFLPSRTTWFSQAAPALDPGLSGREVIEWQISALYKTQCAAAVAEAKMKYGASL